MNIVSLHCLARTNEEQISSMAWIQASCKSTVDSDCHAAKTLYMEQRATPAVSETIACRTLIDLAGGSSADPVLGLWISTLLPCTAAARDSVSPSNFPKQTNPTVSSSAVHKKFRSFEAKLPNSKQSQGPGPRNWSWNDGVSISRARS